LRRQRADLLTVYTPNFDGVKRLDAQIATLEAASKSETESILQSVRNEYLDATRREDLLRESYLGQIGEVADQAGSLVEYGLLKREVDSNRHVYESMLEKTSEANVASALRAGSGRLLDPATPPRFPFRPSWILNLMWGGSIGFLLGLALVTGRERFDRCITQPGQLASYLKVAELGAIPRFNVLPRPVTEKGSLQLGFNGSEPGPPLAALNRRWKQQWSLESAAFRSILTSILFREPTGKLPQVIAVTSAFPAEGKTTLVMNLAAAIAHMKRKVLLIDADAHTRGLHQNFGQPSDCSLFDLLSVNEHESPTGQMIQQTTLPGVFLLPLAQRDQSALDLFPAMDALLNRARRDFDTILIDNMSLRDFPDARVLARMADGVVLVVRAGTTSRDSVLAALTRLRQDGSKLLGTVLNHWVQ